MKAPAKAALALAVIAGALWMLWIWRFNPAARPKEPAEPTLQSIGGTESRAVLGASQSTVSPAAPVAPEASSALLVLANDTTIPADEREMRVMNEARKGPSASKDLMALGDAKNYLSPAAVRALGQIDTPDVRRYLQEKLSDPDPRIVNAATESLADVLKAGAVPSIADTLIRNRVREDGFEDLVCATCVDILGEIKSPAALPVLKQELEATVGTSLGYDYGSRVVKAVERIGDPSAVPMLLEYVKKLDAGKQADPGNDKAQQFFQSRIDETQAVISRLNG